MATKKAPVTPCDIDASVREAIFQYVRDLKDKAHTIGNLGLPKAEFWDSGIFHAAIETIRGTQSASTAEKKRFVEIILTFMQARGAINSFNFTGSGERHDFEVKMPSGRISIIETKGCLDGNNTNIFVRPANADEFIIWSLCQNPGSSPRHNVWSGIHTRLSAEIVARNVRVDALIVWDMLCGSKGRPCPKIVTTPSRQTIVGDKSVPPPCIYLFPRSIPNPRNNADPPCWNLTEVEFAKALYDCFRANDSDVTQVQIHAQMSGSAVARKTICVNQGITIAESAWGPIKRAKA